MVVLLLLLRVIVLFIAIESDWSGERKSPFVVRFQLVVPLVLSFGLIKTQTKSFLDCLTVKSD